jgi:hypothetical protein
LKTLDDPEFIGWKREELESILNTSSMMLDEIHTIIDDKLAAD